MRRQVGIFAAALVLALALGVQLGVAGTLPPVENTRIRAILSPYDFYPASLPKPLVFIGWKQTALSPTVCGTSVTIQFAAPGNREIDWSSSRGCDPQGRVACSADGYPGYGFGIGYNVQRARINHRRVFFSQGNHGSNAWACIPMSVGGYADLGVVGIWESNFISPRQAMNLVAYARR